MVLPFCDEDSIAFMQPTESDEEATILKNIGESVNDQARKPRQSSNRNQSQGLSLFRSGYKLENLS
jgi:hypothetical protein